MGDAKEAHVLCIWGRLGLLRVSYMKNVGVFEINTGHEGELFCEWKAVGVSKAWVSEDK